MSLKWEGDKVLKAIRRDARAKVLAAAVATEAAIKASMVLGGRTESGRIGKELVRWKRNNRKRGIKAGEFRVTKKGMPMLRRVDPTTGGKVKKIGSFRSRPGEVPRVQTGTLRRSYTHELHPVLPIARAGTNLKYAIFLEFGTWSMKPRPHVRPAIGKMLPVYKKIFGIPIVPVLGQGGL